MIPYQSKSDLKMNFTLGLIKSGKVKPIKILEKLN